MEQKNWTHVRLLLGYERLERSELVEPINELYRLWCRLHNLFSPTLKLKKKVREGSKIRKWYEKPRTPAQRAMESEEVKVKTKSLLKREIREVDPFELSEQIEARLKRVWSLNRATMMNTESTSPADSQSQPTSVPLGNVFP